MNLGKRIYFKKQAAGDVRVYSDIKSICPVPLSGTRNLENPKGISVKMPINFVPTSVIGKFCRWVKVKVSKYQPKAKKYFSNLSNIPRKMKK